MWNGRVRASRLGDFQCCYLGWVRGNVVVDKFVVVREVVFGQRELLLVDDKGLWYWGVDVAKAKTWQKTDPGCDLILKHCKGLVCYEVEGREHGLSVGIAFGLDGNMNVNSIVVEMEHGGRVYKGNPQWEPPRIEDDSGEVFYSVSLNAVDIGRKLPVVDKPSFRFNPDKKCEIVDPLRFGSN